MSNLFQLIIATGVVLGFCGTAQAHLGHVGEISGHAHWVGVGALVIAAALGALVLRPVKDNSADDAEAESGPESEADEEPTS